jgi:hypothetical protein
LLRTGLRRSDAVWLGWKHLTNDGFVVTEKIAGSPAITLELSCVHLVIWLGIQSKIGK